MATTNNQTMNPSFSNPDDMPEYVSIYDKPQRGRGRPKTCKLSDEEKKERAKAISKRYYRDNYEYCILRQRIYDEQKKKNSCLKSQYCFSLLCSCILNSLLKTCHHYYI